MQLVVLTEYFEIDNSTCKKFQKRKCLIRIIVGTLCLAIISTEAAQWVLLLQRSDDWCIPYDMLNLSPSFKDYYLKNFTKTTGKSGNLYCANKDSVGELLSLFLHQKLKEERAKGTLCACQNNPRSTILLRTSNASVPPSIIPIGHIVGMRQQEHQDAGAQRSSPRCQYNVSLKKWDTKTTGTILRRIDYRAGQIEIRVSGWYKVYSQVYYTYQPGHPNCSIYHYIYKHSPLPQSPDQLLFQSGKSIEQGTKGIWEYTSNIGGLTKLKNGDSLFVKVSNPHLISANPKGTYFGLQFVDQ